MALDTNYYTTPKTDQKTMKTLLHASFGNCESARNIFFFQKRRWLEVITVGLKILILLLRDPLKCPPSLVT